jgi:hypothetical protein
MRRKEPKSVLKSLKRRLKKSHLLIFAVLALAACGTKASAASIPTAHLTPQTTPFTFDLVPSSSAIRSCLPHASGSATITPEGLNDELTLNVTGLPPNTGFDLFVIEIPHAPFGISWYQTDVQSDSSGNGSVTVRGIFDKETFSVSQPGSPTTTFSPTHQYHLGLWFDDPSVPFQLGCEPGASSPIVTPFNGEQHAGIQVLNTSNFPDNAGPLSHVSR